MYGYLVMKILVFPCNTYEAICYAKELLAEGNEVFGATSVDSEYQIEGVYSQVITLPHIQQSEFEQSFIKLINNYKFTGVWTSISAVYRVTRPILKEYGVTSLSCHPADQPDTPDVLLRNEIISRKPFSRMLESEFQDRFDYQLLHSILKNTMSISGQSHLDKLLTICHIYHSVPKNTDVIEIGSLWGRTAKLFSLLNKLYSVGNLLCIDPWPKEGMSQNAHKVLDSYSRVFDGDKYFSIFCSNLMAEGQQTINYIRDYSNKAIDTYLALENELSSNEFGTTHYHKRVGLLHVDGNHRYEDVVEDIDNYCSLVVAGGWIVFDDYNWPYGDGVTRAVDEYLDKNCPNIEYAFFVGGALFVRLK